MKRQDPRLNRPTTAEDAECAAFNAAFDELGIEWQWDPALYASLRSISDERERLTAYLREYQSHLLKAYDLQFLCDAILEARRRHGQTLARAA